MSQIPSTSGTSGGLSGGSSYQGINDLDMDDFLKLMISELQNQDPLNPMENDQMLQQISQIHEIGSNDKLSATLDSVLLGQNMVSATAMIGKNIKGIDTAGSNVQGVVDRVTVKEGVPTLHIGDKNV